MTRTVDHDSTPGGATQFCLFAPGDFPHTQTAGPDGELLLVCATAQRTDQAADCAMDRISALPAADPTVLDALARLQPLLGAYLAAVERATDLPALTLPGLAAKAALLLLHLRSGEPCEALAASLARDITERGN